MSNVDEQTKSKITNKKAYFLVQDLAVPTRIAVIKAEFQEDKNDWTIETQCYPTSNGTQGSWISGDNFAQYAQISFKVSQSSDKISKQKDFYLTIVGNSTLNNFDPKVFALQPIAGGTIAAASENVFGFYSKTFKITTDKDGNFTLGLKGTGEYYLKWGPDATSISQEFNCQGSYLCFNSSNCVKTSNQPIIPVVNGIPSSGTTSANPSVNPSPTASVSSSSQTPSTTPINPSNPSAPLFPATVPLSKFITVQTDTSGHPFIVPKTPPQNTQSNAGGSDLKNNIFSSSTGTTSDSGKFTCYVYPNNLNILDCFFYPVTKNYDYLKTPVLFRITPPDFHCADLNNNYDYGNGVYVQLMRLQTDTLSFFKPGASTAVDLTDTRALTNGNWAQVMIDKTTSSDIQVNAPNGVTGRAGAINSEFLYNVTGKGLTGYDSISDESLFVNVPLEIKLSFADKISDITKCGS
ncbi:Uncharacterised protein [uncultured archaeon]|nr:Uncharacterised protein [uncultured archaeon]